MDTLNMDSLNFQRIMTEPSESFQLQHTSNQVIMQTQNQKEVTYYLPCYVQFTVKQIEKVDIEGLEGDIAGSLYFTFYYGKIPESIIEQFVGDQNKAIELQFNQEESIQLKQDKGISFRINQEEKIVQFVVRQNFRTNLEGEVFWTPFQTLDLYLAITIQTLHLNPKLNEGRKISIKFNCMDSESALTLAHENVLEFGQYRLACYLMETKYTNKRRSPFKSDHHEEINEEENQPEDDDLQDIEHFQYAHFNIPVYKFPGNSIFSIFVPLWILGFIGMLVFYQQPSFSLRLSTISLLALAFVAFIPTINSSIPQTPHLKMVDIFILMELTSTVLLLVQSYQVRNDTVVQFIWFDNYYFVANLVLNLVPFTVLSVLFVIHKICWERRYKIQKTKTRQKKTKFNKNLWKNRQCDRVFEKIIKNTNVIML